MKNLLTLTALLLACGSVHAWPQSWNAEQTPFRIYGNTYYVGTHGLSAVLITSTEGHILIDGALPESASMIASHIGKLGFDIKDVKIILNSHAHFDHSGGIAELQRMSGARVIASDRSAPVLSSGQAGRDDPQFNVLPKSPPVMNVEPLGARGKITLGSLDLRVIPTPGHTAGGTSWTWKACEDNRCLNLVYADSLNAVSDDTFRYSGDARYPTARADLEASIAAMRSTPCDIIVAAHPDLTGLWTVFDEHGQGDHSKLIDANACRRYADAAQERFERRLKKEADSL